MKWVIFTGTWRLTNSDVERDVRAQAQAVLRRGDGIITGGATGVDYFAMDEAMRFDRTGSRLMVFMPTGLDNYMHDYRKNWLHAPVTSADIDKLETLLKNLAQVQPKHIHALPFTGEITQGHYNLRHNEEVAHADELYAFQVNESTGTQDTIDKAREAGLSISLHNTYQITP